MSSFFFPSVTLFLSFAVTLIAWQQWRVADDKLRLDLFERRYKIYDATMRFVANIVSKATFEDADLVEFYRQTSDAVFFFRSDVVEYLDVIRDRAVKTRSLAHQFRDLPVGDYRTALVEKESAELMWLSNQLPLIKDVFLPYLSFDKIRRVSLFRL